MRNLKKVLSLALVFVMVFALMVSAGAAYSDQSKIENKEAVEMVTALKIMQGRNGAFDPTAPVQRGELAKMLYVASTGSDDGAVLYASYQNKFTDVPNTVAEYWGVNYIKWAAFKGVVSGKSPTMFYPKDSVLGVEALKMALTALGYDSKVEGYQDNADWQMNIASRAQDLGLLKDISYDCLNRAMTRDEAAQLIYNMLNNNRVIYRASTTNDDRPVVVNRDTDKDGKVINMMEAVFGVKKATGLLINTPTSGLNGLADKDKLEILEKGDKVNYSDAATDPLIVTGNTEISLGHEVNVYYKTDDKKTVYGIFETGASQTVAPTAVPSKPGPKPGLGLNSEDGKGVQTLSGTATAVVLRTVDGVVYKDFSIKQTVTLGKASLKNIAATTTDAAYTKLIVKQGVDGKGSKTYVEDDVKNVIGGDVIAKDDVVLVTKQWTSTGTDADGDPVDYFKYSTVKADSITGKVTSYTSAGKLVINGTQYAVSQIEGYTDDLDEKDDMLNQSGTFYLVGNDIAGFVPDAAITDKFAIVTAIQNKSGNAFNAVPAKVAATLSDGTTGVFEVESAAYDLDKIGGTTDEADQGYGTATLDATILIKYATGSDGKLILGDKVTAFTSVGTAKDAYKNGYKLTVTVPGVDSAPDTNVAYVVNADTIFFVKGDNNYAAYVGYSKVPAFAAGSDVSVLDVKKNGTASIVVLTDMTPASSSTDLAYVLDFAKSTRDGKTFYTVKMFDGTEVKDYETTLGAAESAVKPELGFATYELTNGVVSKLLKKGDVATGETTAYSEGQYIKVGDTLFELTSDCNVWTIDIKGMTVSSGADISVKTTDEDGTTVFYTTDTNTGKINNIYVETNK